MVQESDVVFIKKTHIVNIEAEHNKPFKTNTESKAAVNLGVNASVFEHLRVNHSAAENFNPALALAHRAALSAAVEAGNVNFA